MRNFELILVVLTLVMGVVWLVDALFFAKARRAAIARAAPGDAGPKEPMIVDYSRALFPVLLFVVVLRGFIAEPFKIPSNSMMPTLLTGDFILVNKFSYGLRLPVLRTKILDTGAPERGDVVVFRYPVDPTQDYIKRVVGLPGDEISYHGHELRVNGELVASTPAGTYAGQGSGREMTGAEVLTESLGGVQHRVLQWPLAPYARRPGDGTWRVPEGHYFMMGDNRDNSEDSRFWGFVPEDHLVGRAFVIWLHVDGGMDFSRIGDTIE